MKKSAAIEHSLKPPDHIIGITLSKNGNSLGELCPLYSNTRIITYFSILNGLYYSLILPCFLFASPYLSILQNSIGSHEIHIRRSKVKSRFLFSGLSTASLRTGIAPPSHTTLPPVHTLWGVKINTGKIPLEKRKTGMLPD